jgi:hypothetical protein
MSDEPKYNCPDYRATLSGGDLNLVPWAPFLLGRSGPFNRLLHAGRGRTPAIADLTIVREEDDWCHREVIVTEITGGGDTSLRERLVDWASLLAYQRMWFSDEVMELDRTAAGVNELAETRCSTCRSRWSDDSPQFWVCARGAGIFPLRCPLCGHAVPQWSVAATPPSGVKIGRPSVGSHAEARTEQTIDQGDRR